MPKFSVVIIIKSRRKQLANLLYSMSEATLQPTDVQVVCMDNINNITVPENMNVTLHNMNCGDDLPLAAARNKGFEATLTSEVIFIDVDCIVSPTLFANMLNKLKQNVIIAAYPLYLASLPQNGNFGDLKLLAIPHPTREIIPAEIPIPHLKFWSIIFAVQKQTFKLIGGFDQAFTGYGAEDTDFAMAFNEVGVKQLFVTDYVLHQYHIKYDPPLNHFEAIIHNATIYHNKWGDYPMQRWLKAFSDMGLSTLNDSNELHIIRRPTENEIDNCISKYPY